MFTYESDWLPYFNIILGVIGLSWLVLRTSRRWYEYPREMKLLLAVTAGFVLALLETSAEQIAYDHAASFNTVVIAGVKLFLLYVLFTTRDSLYRTGERTEEGHEDSDNPNRDIVA